MSVFDVRRAMVDSNRDSSFGEVCYYPIKMWKILLFTKDAKVEVKYSKLRTLVGYILSLSHSNAVAKRSFAMLHDIYTKKQIRLSTDNIIATAVVKSSANLYKKTLRPIEISDDQLSNVVEEFVRADKKKQKRTQHNCMQTMTKKRCNENPYCFFFFFYAHDILI